MRTVLVTLTLSMLVALATSTPVDAQSVRRGTLSGELVSQTALVPSLGSIEVFTTPARAKAGFFVLTQVCVERRRDVRLSGNTIGEINLDDDCIKIARG